MNFLSRNETDTIGIANDFSASLQAGDVVALSGELGAGKSVFCRALMRSLGVQDEALPSPTFAIIQEYDGAIYKLAHMDWYRLEDADEIEMLGVRDYFQPPWICLIEWAERADTLLSDRVIHVEISCVEHDLDARVINIMGSTSKP
ncbi:MAG: tRNA (adenosine(37)-N6)-threonylcarbamoyltransferase complex ATPase subunit type 1 TsaE [Mariprofundus sp.]|nr:tRNA (adenosine(37)-N6)-threonylcarbamoyltransferase complex ATPase subunit type 1 TsaE [Mariprofundus sp.]